MSLSGLESCGFGPGALNSWESDGFWQTSSSWSIVEIKTYEDPVRQCRLCALHCCFYMFVLLEDHLGSRIDVIDIGSAFRPWRKHKDTCSELDKSCTSHCGQDMARPVLWLCSDFALCLSSSLLGCYPSFSSVRYAILNASSVRYATQAKTRISVGWLLEGGCNITRLSCDYNPSRGNLLVRLMTYAIVIQQQGRQCAIGIGNCERKSSKELHTHTQRMPSLKLVAHKLVAAECIDHIS